MQPIRGAVLAFDGVSLFHLSVSGIVFGIQPQPSGLLPYEVAFCASTPGCERCDQGTHCARRMRAVLRSSVSAWHSLCLTARALNPARWSGPTRNGSPVGPVTLNTERDCVVKAYVESMDSQSLAA